MSTFNLGTIPENFIVHISRLDEDLARLTHGKSYGVDRHDIKKKDDWPFLAWHVVITPIRKCRCCGLNSEALWFDGHAESFEAAAQEAWDRMESFGMDRIKAITNPVK